MKNCSDLNLSEDLKIFTFLRFRTIFQGHTTSVFGKYLLEDDLRSRIFKTFVVIFLARLSLLARISEHLKNGIILPIFNGFLPQKGHLELSGAFFLAEIFENVSFDPYNFRITRL